MKNIIATTTATATCSKNSWYCIYITKELLCCGIKNCCILLGVAIKHYNLNCVKLATTANKNTTVLFIFLRKQQNHKNIKISGLNIKEQQDCKGECE